MSLPAQCRDYRQVLPCQYVGAEDLNSGPHTFQGNTLLTKPSILPPRHIPLKKKKRYLVYFY